MENLVVLDLEIYPNYSLFAFKNIDNNRVICLEIKGQDSCLDQSSLKKLNSIMHKRTTFGFNSRNYDLPLILYALRGRTAFEIYKMGNSIIENNIPGWKIMKDFGLFKPDGIKHFDIQEPAPGVRVGLKLYGGRMHSRRLQDLPIEPGTILTEREMEETRLYCINDLDTTIDLFRKIEPEIQLRSDMSKKYKQDLMSKSDAQIAEAVIKSELQKIMGSKRRLKAPTIPEGKTFRYEVPDYISFESENLKLALETIRNHDFELDGRGSIKLPKELKSMKLKVGFSTYQLGVGGIHSTEKKQCIIPNANQFLIDKDVASYYPTIILTRKLFPKQLGESFLKVYKQIVDDRLSAKKIDKGGVEDRSLKIVINGSFGKLGSKWSALYSPDLMMAVTLTGQLALLMLIEKLELAGISVVSANTDGFVSLLDKEKYDIYTEISDEWEQKTKFVLEESFYKALYSRDVNNYLAVTEKGCKGKGIFTKAGLTKNPQAPICALAVEKLLSEGIPIKDTVRNCKDISKFINVRSVAGGAVFGDEYLGKVVRWVYSTEGSIITYKKNGNKVAKSDGSLPVMEITKELPESLDYDRYIEESMSILDDIGLTSL